MTALVAAADVRDARTLPSGDGRDGSQASLPKGSIPTALPPEGDIKFRSRQNSPIADLEIMSNLCVPNPAAVQN